MPVRAPRICSCGKVVPSGQRCACQRAKAKAYDASRGTAASRGYTGSWRKAAAAFLALPGNERCSCGCGRVANMVDHRIAPKGDQSVFWDRSNWQPFNVLCNTRKAIRSEGGFGRPSVIGGQMHGQSTGLRHSDANPVSARHDGARSKSEGVHTANTPGGVETFREGVETARGPFRAIAPNSVHGKDES